MWLPRLSGFSGPRYLSIVDALEREIATGGLLAGTRLPTHRELAEALGVTVGTVTRAYGEAIRRGLVSGEVGRGTFVRQRPADAESTRPNAASLIDLSENHPPHPSNAIRAALGAALRNLADSHEAGRLLDYPPEGGAESHREAGAQWLTRFGLKVPPDQVLVTSGSQHGLTTVFTALIRAGDLVLTEALTYPGMKTLASLLGLRVQGLAIDRDGLDPDAFEVACRGGAAKALYCVPTLHNPTTAVMPVDRRREIAAIAERYGVLIVEDDAHGPLLEPTPPPLSSFAPESSFFLSGTAKTLAPGLRIGFLVAPPQRLPRLMASIRATTWMAAPLMAEIAARWIADGTASATLLEHRVEAEARQALAGQLLRGFEVETHPRSFHLWLHLPEPWRCDTFAEEARRRGVAVTAAHSFVVGRMAPPPAVRLCLGSARDRAQLATGIGILVDILEGPPDAAVPIV